MNFAFLLGLREFLPNARAIIQYIVAILEGILIIFDRVERVPTPRTTSSTSRPFSSQLAAQDVEFSDARERNADNRVAPDDCPY